MYPQHYEMQILNTARQQQETKEQNPKKTRKYRHRNEIHRTKQEENILEKFQQLIEEVDNSKTLPESELVITNRFSMTRDKKKRNTTNNTGTTIHTSTKVTTVNTKRLPKFSSETTDRDQKTDTGSLILHSSTTSNLNLMRNNKVLKKDDHFNHLNSGMVYDMPVDHRFVKRKSKRKLGLTIISESRTDKKEELTDQLLVNEYE